MPRISNYRPHKGNDYKFLDKIISEQYTVGGTDLFLHRFLGPKNPPESSSTADQPIYDVIQETNIQDLLFLENRDRKYDPDIYTLRGIFNVQDLDFNLSQFGLFIDNDTLFLTVHMNDFISTVGRKPISGDVLEIPALRDYFALSQADYSLPRFFVISDVGRAAEGFSPTWYPHLYRLKLNKIGAEAQYSDILNAPADTDANFLGDYDPNKTYYPGDIVRYQGVLYTTITQSTGNLPTDTNYFGVYSGQTINDVLSTANTSTNINDALIAQAESDTLLSGYETRQFFTLAVNTDALLQTADITQVDASYTGWDASEVLERPKRAGYTGYLLGDGVPENGVDFGHGINFPPNPIKDDFFLRTDFLPNRLFRYNGSRWIKHEDAVRHTLTNTDSRQTLKTTFINNNTVTDIGGEQVVERQDISKALRPRADF
jgi:hypothetical protein